MPTCKMKLTPFLRNVRSSSGEIPSRMEGACSSSASVNIHCCSASATAGGGGRSGSRRCAGALLMAVDTMVCEFVQLGERSKGRGCDMGLVSY